MEPKVSEKENKFSFQSIPWNNILDSIASDNPFLRRYIESERFSQTESDICVPCYADSQKRNMVDYRIQKPL